MDGKRGKMDGRTKGEKLAELRCKEAPSGLLQGLS